MISTDSLITEIKEVLDGTPPSRGEAMLHDMTELFLKNAERYSKEQLTVFDDVFHTIIEHVDRDALSELSRRLAACPTPPPALLRKLDRRDRVQLVVHAFERGLVPTRPS